ncbi:MAG: hypothetical protein V4548_01860 [Bacteroidota bacterium]
MKKNKLILGVVVLVVIAVGIYSYLYQGHRDIASEEGSYSVTAISIFDEFKKDENKSNQKYLDKTIEIYGKTTSVDLSANVIVVDEKLVAVFKDKITTDIKIGSEIKIKGRFLGYDELLEEMKMDQCVIVNP